ncbi:MAG TPA: hypothetical protein VIQ31_08235 [Phormidium sp.]
MVDHSANSPEVSSSSSADEVTAPTEGLKTLDQLHDGKLELKQEGQPELEEATPTVPTASPATGATTPAPATTTQTSAPATAQPIPQTAVAPGTPGAK